MARTEHDRRSEAADASADAHSRAIQDEDFHVTRRWRMTGGPRSNRDGDPVTNDGMVTIASFGRHEDAAALLDRLARSDDVDVDGMRIVGRDVKMSELVTGKFTWGRAIIGGALTGLVVGATLGGLLGIFDPFRPFESFAFGIWFGGLFGLVIGAIAGALSRAFSPHRFTSVQGLVAGSYDVLAEPGQEHVVRHVLDDEVHIHRHDVSAPRWSDASRRRDGRAPSG